MMRNRAPAALSVLASVCAACNTFDAPGVDSHSKLVIPIDERPVVEPRTAPPPIAGGTLAVSPDGVFAVAADPDRNRVSIVDLRDDGVTHVELEEGDQPGRVIVGPKHEAYVALRGASSLVAVRLPSGEITGRTQVCAAPRGLALSADGDLLHVACAEGRLLSIDTRDRSIARELRIEAELRDVVASGSGLRLSTFKSSELLTIDEAGQVSARTAPQAFELTVEDVEEAGNNINFRTRLRPMQPHLAWRTVQAEDGSVVMLHQASTTEELDIKQRDELGEGTRAASPYGGGSSGLGCQSVVVTGVSQFGPQMPRRTIALHGGVLNVDMALSPDSDELAIVESGRKDEGAPQPRVVIDPESSTFASTGLASPASFGDIRLSFPAGTRAVESHSRVLRVPFIANSLDGRFAEPVSGQNTSFQGCEFPRDALEIPGQATAVAYTSAGTLVVQSREPALLTIVAKSGFGARLVELGGDSVRDTGHEIFHRDSGGGIACASCHGEGAEDGHVWNFTEFGPRRTQALHVGLAGTAPFHWAGDERDLDMLMDDVFVGRMGGVHQSAERVASLSRFLFALEPPPPGREAGDPAALRGKALFHSPAVGCGSCHSGSKFSDNKSYDVGTSDGELLQVPSLRGIGYRAPFIHTGCAATLRDRFDPRCGGRKHGNVAKLEEAELDDLVAYLQTL